MANKKDKLQKVETEPISSEQAQEEKQELKNAATKAAKAAGKPATKATKTGRKASSKEDEIDDDDIEQITPEQARQEMMAAIQKLKKSQQS